VTTYTQTFGGTNIYPSDVSYRYVSLTVDQALAWPLETAPTTNVVASIMDINPTATSLVITMPDATEVGVGQTVLFNNVGSNTFTIKSNTGTQICAPQSGTTFQIYLTTNATAGGTWRSFQYGASASSENAANLAGLGLKAIATTLNQSIDVATFNSNYTAGIPDRAKAFVWTGGSGTFGLTAAPTLGADWFVQVRNNGSGDLTIDPNSSETINGQATLILSPGDSAIVITDGLEFWTIGFGQSAEYAFSLLAIDVSGSGNYTLAANELNRTVYVFTGTLTGCTTSPTGAVKYTYDANFVDLIFPTITATSNTTACTITGLPAWLWPATTQQGGFAIINNNSVGELGFFNIDSSGVISLNRNTLTAFTNTGTKGVTAGATFRFQRAG